MLTNKLQILADKILLSLVRKKNFQPDLTINELLLHIHVCVLELKSRAEGGASAEQPVVELLCLAVVPLKSLLLPLLLQLLAQLLLPSASQTG